MMSAGGMHGHDRYFRLKFKAVANLTVDLNTYAFFLYLQPGQHQVRTYLQAACTTQTQCLGFTGGKPSIFSAPSIYSPGSTRNLIPPPLPVYTPHGHVTRCPTEFPVTNYHLVKQTRLQYYTIGHAKPSIRGFMLLCNIKCPHVHL